MFHYTYESTDVTDFVSVIRQTPCVSKETRRTIAKTLKFESNCSSTWIYFDYTFYFCWY